MKCKPLLIGLDVTGNEVLYPSTSRVINPTILNHYISKGFNIFRILFRWERLQPDLKNNLVAANTPSLNVPFDATYLNVLLSYVDICVKNKVQCILQLDNGGWYDVSYNKTYKNDGTTACPESNYVYVNQKTTTIGATNYVGPSIAQYANLFVKLANTTNNGYTLLNNPYVRFGLGQNTTIDNKKWVPVVASLISNLRDNKVNNILHYDFKNSGYDDLSDVSQIVDSQNKSILNVNHYNDATNGNGTSVLSTDNYLMTAVTIDKTMSSLNSSSKISFGDVRFDSGSTSITAMCKFLDYAKTNISTFESVCFFGIGDSGGLPSCYDLNYTSKSDGTTTDKTQITDILNPPVSVDTDVSLVPDTNSSAKFIYGSPFGATYQSLTGGKLYLPFNILNNGMSFTLECWYQKPLNDTSIGALIGSKDSIGIVFNSSSIEYYCGDTSYINMITRTNYSDNKWHHYEINVDSTGMYFFIDGKLIGKSNMVLSKLDNIFTNFIGIRSLSNDSTSDTLNGNISNFVVWSGLRHNTDFDVPTAYYSGTETNLMLNFKLNGTLDSEIFSS